MPTPRLLHAVLFTPTPEGFWGPPVLCWSDPGIGKTAAIKAAIHRAGLAYERLSPAERGEGQFGVVPVPTADGYLSYPIPDWARKFDGNVAGCIFLDEISTSPPALQSPLLGFSQLRILGTHQFGSRVRIIAAANETADAAGGWDLAPALANRFGHFSFEGLSTADWCVGLLGGFAAESDGPVLNPKAEEDRVMGLWPAAIARARGLVSGFIQKRPALLHAKPQRHAPGASRAWPSRRSVEYSTYALAASTVHGLSEIETDEYMGSFVGTPWVAEFRAWTAAVDLPDPVALLDGREVWKHDVQRLDRTLAVLGACAATVLPVDSPNRVARVEKCWQLIGSVLDDVADAAIPAARALTDQAVLLYGAKYKGSLEIINRINPILRRAGFVK